MKLLQAQWLKAYGVWLKKSITFLKNNLMDDKIINSYSSQPQNTAQSTGVAEMNVQTQVFNNFDELATMQKEWDDFIESLDCDIFLTYDWCRVWWKYYGGKNTLRVFVFRCKGELVGLLPTFVEKIGFGPLALKIARIVGTTFVLSDINPPVAAGYMRNVMKQWLERLYLEFRPDIICIGPVSGTYQRADQLVDEFAALNGSYFHIEKKQADVMTIFRLGNSVEEYLNGLSGKERHEINRHSRNILKVAHQNDARLGFELVSVDELAEAFDDFIRMHNAQWQRLGQSGHFIDWPHSEAFHHEAAGEQLKRGRLRLFKASVGQTRIGYEYAYKFSQTYFHYLNARTSEDEFERVAVGKVNFCEFVKKALSENVNLINSMRGRYEYKMRMGGLLLPTFVVLAAQRSFLSKFRVGFFRKLSWAIHIFYYKVWFSRVVPRLGLKRKPLWNLWIRTNVLAR